MKTKDQILERIGHYEELVLSEIARRDGFKASGNEFGFDICNENARVALEKQKLLLWVLEPKAYTEGN